jgi:hypothetical protein
MGFKTLLGCGSPPVVAAGGTFAPLTDIGSNLQYWYDANDAASISHTSGVISTINDKSGKGNHLTSLSGREPAYSSTSGVGGTKPGITGSGNRCVNRTASVSISATGGISIYVVIIPAAPTGTANDKRVVSMTVGVASDWSSSGYALVRAFSAGSTTNTYGGFRNGTTSGLSLTGAVANGTAALISVTNSASTMIASLNATESTSASSTMPGTSFTQIAMFAQAGGNNDLTENFEGVICEVFGVQGVPITTLDEKIEGYLAHKWWGAGVANPLPSGHTYKNTAP